ncbi:hypothetical protein ACWEWX_43195, partial [Streptomyces asiaticus]
GRWISMRNLLAETPTWSLWTQRTQVLATPPASMARGRAPHAEAEVGAAHTALTQGLPQGRS